MKCKKCGENLDNEEVLAEVAAHNDELMDIIVKCPSCGIIHNAFVEWTHFTVIE